MRRKLVRFAASLCTAGLLVGTLFFAASLTPSLVPRPSGLQGVLSGVALAAGYGIGVLGRWLWLYLELPVPRERAQWLILLIAGTVSAGVALAFLWQAAAWQNSIRTLMGLEPVDSIEPLRIGAIALPLFAVLLGFGRLFRLTLRAVATRLKPFIPRRIANAVGVVVAVMLFWSVIDGVLVRVFLRAADASWQRMDELAMAELQPPSEPLRTGSAASLVSWDNLGRQGRQFIASGPRGDDLSRFLGRPAPDPIRVYVGMRSADSIRARARLALAELERVGAFERSALLIVTPTGTGWIDPKALDTVEYLLRGDIASVAVQYSYLPSWLTLLADPDYAAETAVAVFAHIYGHWTRLPPESRPRLYLHGMSLGALNSERSADIYDVLADPFHGALWSGPPFRAATWRTFTELREPGSPAWLPRFRDGSVVRFTNQVNALDLPGAEWGPLRIVYLQYASDPMTFFEPQAAYRRPDWLGPMRGPDVSPALRWFPIITMLQLGLDIVQGGAAPVGFGHVYAPEHYIDAWLAVTGVADWTAEDIARLKAHFRAARLAPLME